MAVATDDRKHVAAQAMGEYQVKAAFIYNFTKFISWPSEAFSDANSPFVIGVLGEDPFGQALDQALAGKSVNEHPITVKRIKGGVPLSNFHLLFISSSERRKLSPIFDSLRGAAVLTIGECDQFTQRGGMIEFEMEEGKVYFDINSAATENARIKVSSKLLALAKSTRLRQR